MAYEPTNWKSGDTVTSAKLNHMENGIAASGVLVVESTFTEQAITLQKTARELYAAYQAQSIIIHMKPDESNEFYFSVTVACLMSEGLYVFSATMPEMGEAYFRASSADDYPIFEMQ